MAGIELKNFASPDETRPFPPGHDAEIVGDETCVFIDFTGFESYAKQE